MLIQDHSFPAIRSLKRFAWISFFAWTMIIAASLGRIIHLQYRHLDDMARMEARGSLKKDLILEIWVAKQGGVYVPVSEEIQPNPFLSKIQERDITTPSGKRLTLMNSGFLMRQLYKTGWEELGLRGHFTSLSPLNPENAPDAWEKEALEKLKAGCEEVFSMAKIGGQPYVRLIHPVIVRDECLKCHADQGFKAGDFGGGLSLSLPIDAYLKMIRGLVYPFIIGHGRLWLIGAAGIFLAFRKLRRNAEEQERSQQALLESEFFYHSLVENIPQCIFRKDIHGVFTFANQRFCDSLKKKAEEIIGKTDNDLFPEELAKKYRDDDRRVIQLGVFLEMVEERSSPDGELRLSQAIKSPLFNANGEAIGVQGIYWDITEQKKTEEALRESENRFRHILDNMPNVGMQGFKPDGTIHYWNRANEVIFGYTKEEAIGRNIAELIVPPDKRNEFRKFVADCALTGMRPPAEERLLMRKDGSPAPVLLSLSIVRHRIQKPDLFFVVIDLRNLRQTQKALRVSEEKYRRLYESAYDFIFTYDIEGNILSTNSACSLLLGYTPEEFRRMNFEQIAAEDCLSLVREKLRLKLERHQKATRYELDVIAKDGRRISVELVTQLIERGDEIVCLMGIGRDITERRKIEEEKVRLENQLLQAQKMEAVGQLAGGVAHDFNNLLTGVIGNIHLAEKRAAEDVKKYLREAAKAAGRSADVVQQLLAFSRKTRLERQRVNLNRLVQESYPFVRQTIDRRIEIVCDAEANLPNVFADATQLKTVLLNLCINARDAIHEAMRLQTSFNQPPILFAISIAARSASVDRAYCEKHSYARPGRFVILRVSDNGAGMDEETQRRVFEPFFTTKEVGEGTGLGLSSAYGIVKQHEGWIDLRSQPGQGATFEIYLPVEEEKNGVETVEPAILSEPLLGRETILIVEDEEMIRGLSQEILELHGYTVLLAPDGEEALNLLRQQGDRIDMALLDLSMPRMSGHEFLRAMQEMGKKVKVIICSGYAELAKEPSLGGEMIVDYISKPYHPTELIRKVREVLDRES
ncbi:MAG: PAS domain S-box protein [Candidatus Omnitrophota bacterium]